MSVTLTVTQEKTFATSYFKKHYDAEQVSGSLQKYCLLLSGLLQKYCLLLSGSLQKYCLLLSGSLQEYCLLLSGSLQEYCLLLSGSLQEYCLLVASLFAQACNLNEQNSVIWRMFCVQPAKFQHQFFTAIEGVIQIYCKYVVP